MFHRIFIAPILPSVKISLGRWERTNMKLNQIKIDWANIDHCGTCSYEVVPLSNSIHLPHPTSTPIDESIQPSSSFHSTR